MRRVRGLLVATCATLGTGLALAGGEAVIERLEFNQTHGCLDYRSETKQAQCLQSADLNGAQSLVKLLFAIDAVSGVVCGGLALQEAEIIPRFPGQRNLPKHRL